MKKLILMVLAVSVFVGRMEALQPESIKLAEPGNTGCETMKNVSDTNDIELDDASKTSKKKKIKKPIVIKFNSEYKLMVYSEDLEGVFTWDEGVKASEDLVAFGFDDWYMPSQDELIAVYEKRKKIGNFINATYWCSTEAYIPGGNLAYFHSFYDNKLAYYPKQLKRLVRCVRKVKLK